MKYFTEKNIVISCTLIIIVGFIVSCFLAYYDYWRENVDAVTENPIIVHTQGVDVKNLEIIGGTYKDHKVIEEAWYKVGDIPTYYNSYCKMRRAQGTAEYWLIDNNTSEVVAWFQAGDYKEMPLGCTPPEQDKLVPSKTRPIPKEASGRHVYWKMVVTRLLPDGRIRKEDYQSLPFYVIKL